MIRWPWRREAKLVETMRTVSIRAMELVMAKEILEKVFHARPRRGGGDDPEEAGGEKCDDGSFDSRR